MNASLIARLSTPMLIATIGLLLFSFIGLSGAQEAGVPRDDVETETPGEAPTDSASGGTSATESATPENQICLVEVAGPILEEEREMITFLADHFRSEKANSALVNDANIRYELFVDRIEAIVDEFAVAQGGQDYIQEAAEIDACRRFANRHLRTIAALMMAHNAETSSGKVTYELVSKHKAINDQLQGLNRDFAAMLGGFKALGNKLPGVTE